MIRRMYIMVPALLLVACAQVPLKVVNVPVATPVYCHPDLGPEPAYPDTDAALQATPDIFEAVKLLLKGRLMRIQRDAEKSSALQACASGSK